MYLAMSIDTLSCLFEDTACRDDRVLRGALRFVIDHATHDWVRTQNVREGLAPAPMFVLEAREKLRQAREVRSEVSSSPLVASLRTKAAAYKWLGRWRRRFNIRMGDSRARQVIPQSSMQRKANKHMPQQR